jgi:hypothetical protein
MGAIVNMTKETEERQRLNAQRLLYKKRVKDNKLVDIGYYRSICTSDSFIPSWELYTAKSSCIPRFFDRFTKERYYPGWLGNSNNRELVEVSIPSPLKEIYTSLGKVVGFTNVETGWRWYYQDFINTHKTYY